MYEDARRSDPRPGDLWWLPGSWWPTSRPWLIRPDPNSDSPDHRIAVPHDAADRAWERGADEQIYVHGKIRPCLILSPALDFRASRSDVPRFIALHTFGYEEKGMDTARATAIRRRQIPHAYPIYRSTRYGLDERWIDYTSLDPLPRRYLDDRRFEPICRLVPDEFEKLLRHFGAWLTRDQRGPR